MSQSAHGPDYDQVFVVRCWNEKLDKPASPPEWRMRVMHINSKTERHSDDLREISKFIEDALAASAVGDRGERDRKH